ncbi:hypothetical protein BFL35_09815 [Clavibacter michiganensis]|nr:hypothetical protein BFL35_09815 [Clavibacter michiganensis]
MDGVPTASKATSGAGVGSGVGTVGSGVDSGSGTRRPSLARDCVTYPVFVPVTTTAIVAPWSPSCTR